LNVSDGTDLIRTTSSTTFTQPTTFGRRHYSPPCSIFYDFPWGLHSINIFSQRLPSGNPKIGTFVITKFWTLIYFSNKTYFEHVRELNYKPQKGLSSSVLHVPIGDDLTPTVRGFVVGSQIPNLTPNLYFDHNSCISSSNGQCESTLGIHASKTFE